MRNTFRKFLVSLTLTLAATSAFADPPRPNHDHWRNTAYPGHYVLFDRASNSYIETVNCTAAWRFTLVSNQNNTLTLYEASRGMTMMLNYDGMYLKAQGASDFTFYQAGTFDTRTIFYHNDAAGNYTGSISKGHGCEWSEWFPGYPSASFHFVEKSTTAGGVEMYDGSRDLYVWLNANSVSLKAGNGAYAFFKNGHW